MSLQIKNLRRPWDSIAWWEIRRIPYNLVLLIAGLISIAAIELVGGRLLPTGEDAVEPLGLIAGVIGYAVMANVCYCLGCLSELVWTRRDAGSTAAIRKRLFLAGTIFSTFLTLVPAAIAFLIWAASGFK